MKAIFRTANSIKSALPSACTGKGWAFLTWRIKFLCVLDLSGQFGEPNFLDPLLGASFPF
jgi:hypothetical protein